MTTLSSIKLIKKIWLIAANEWQYWLRSHLSLGATGIFLVLILTTSFLTTAHMDSENHLRSHQQSEAEETFLSQPDRHPHRMVHYGHYLFRTPAPLAIFDPGLDPVTGQAIFLEGHHQNSVMFAESTASADLGGLSWLNPALVYQLFAPLVLLLVGHSSVVREREAAGLLPLLALGISPHTLVFGKALALLLFSLLLLIPLLISSTMAFMSGESSMTLLLLFLNYAIYIAIWVVLTLLVSIAFTKRSTVLAAMTGLWFSFSLVLPSIAVSITADTVPVAGKIETDLAMLSSLRKLGDGHNANDPAFQQLRADVLKKYNVERIEDLPVNFRGIVAMEGEQKLTKVLNEFANLRMAAELSQTAHLADYGWLTPMLAVTVISRTLAGTDLAHYHRFQREAEAVRLAFVQGLNRAHIETLSYEDDINRNKNEDAWQRARVDAANWQVLDAFQFNTASLTERINSASPSIRILLAWLIALLGLLLWSCKRVMP